MHPEAGELAAQLRHFRAVSCKSRGAAMRVPQNHPLPDGVIGQGVKAFRIVGAIATLSLGY
ncbi:hypothetical protein TH30_02810 [Thalassospira profundimaris]|uniref:Uncharacterized protein n=1 Tax=Thalassospira profundimaris TaxID=502049 RepID=A0A367X6F7_9PROT|nr:hypothetical protein TH30_02810 [Thalassospira profundimaris]